MGEPVTKKSLEEALAAHRRIILFNVGSMIAISMIVLIAITLIVEKRAG